MSHFQTSIFDIMNQIQLIQISHLKYLIRSPIQNGDNLSRILLLWSLILMNVFNASSLELLFRPPTHLFCVAPLQRPGNPCSFSSSCVIFNRCCRNVKEQNEKSKGRHVIILCHSSLYRQNIKISFSWHHLHISTHCQGHQQLYTPTKVSESKLSMVNSSPILIHVVLRDLLLSTWGEKCWFNRISHRMSNLHQNIFTPLTYDYPTIHHKLSFYS